MFVVVVAVRSVCDGVVVRLVVADEGMSSGCDGVVDCG